MLELKDFAFRSLQLLTQVLHFTFCRFRHVTYKMAPITRRVSRYTTYLMLAMLCVLATYQGASGGANNDESCSSRDGFCMPQEGQTPAKCCVEMGGCESVEDCD
ncbi:uncharacterized protein LOC115928160 [Strongylocentrotus purpuratus]|uniref:Uncharacterized protein n=1 Tax=Strongylocentrotus purpuratus TaxID=7668 RepID=A0A7M7PIS4_STRPU|nr:uncharacterized protein LOC115928160 [Strongylocentrotus purpuratus]